MHIYKLTREVQVALQIAGVDDVDDDVRGLLYYLFANIEFLRGVGRQGLGAWKVYYVELLTLKGGVPFLCVYRHARVVADMFVGS